MVSGTLFSWPLQDLNLRPTDYESAALTAELRGLAQKAHKVSKLSQKEQIAP